MVRKLISVAIAFCTLSVFYVVAAPSAQSYVLNGCRQSTSTNIHLDDNTDGFYTPTVLRAVGAWQDNPSYVGSPLTFQAWPGSNNWIADVNVGATGYSGVTSYQCTGTNMNYAHITLNQYYTNAYDDNAKKSVAAHELGHLLGLGHSAVPLTPCGNTALMYFSDARWFTCLRERPNLDDAGGINAWGY